MRSRRAALLVLLLGGCARLFEVERGPRDVAPARDGAAGPDAERPRDGAARLDDVGLSPPDGEPPPVDGPALPHDSGLASIDAAAADAPPGGDGGPSPCQLSWDNGWQLLGEVGVNCYAACDDASGGYSVECDWDGVCSCEGGSVSRTCATMPCQALVQTGCCMP